MKKYTPRKQIPEYNVWQHMRSRCNNPNNRNYNRYGGRGITVCPRWDDFENFFADMGRRPTDLHTIERKDNNKGYSPDNCCWATRDVQAFNREATLRITGKDGRVQSAQAWERELGFTPGTISDRIELGWTKDCLLDPVHKCVRRKNPLVEINGRSMTLTEWSKVSGIKVTTLYSRIFIRNLPPERLLDPVK